MARVSYRDLLRSKGLKPAPPHAKLRTTKAVGHVELTPKGKIVYEAA